MAKANDSTDSIHLVDRAAWRAWLAKHHAVSTGVWLISYKKAAGKPRIEYGEAVEEALCFGWIDSREKSLDDERSMQYYAPRKAGGTWSRSNKERVERLIREGRMTPAGLAKIEAAKADGSWTKLDAVEDLVIPPDLEQALAAVAAADRNFRAFTPGSRKNILAWIASAKRPETRQRRVRETAELAAKNLRANHSQEWK